MNKNLKKDIYIAYINSKVTNKNIDIEHFIEREFGN